MVKKRDGRILSERVGKYLQHMLKKNGYTQEKFAEKYNCDVRTVRRWIKNGVNDINTIDSIASFFGDTLWDIIRETDDVPFSVCIVKIV